MRLFTPSAWGGNSHPWQLSSLDLSSHSRLPSGGGAGAAININGGGGGGGGAGSASSSVASSIGQSFKMSWTDRHFRFGSRAGNHDQVRPISHSPFVHSPV